MASGEEAAQDLEQAARELRRFVEEYPEESWHRVTGAEGWSAAALAYHCALGNDVALGWICQMLVGWPVTETSETHNAFNASDAALYAGLTRAEVAEALRRTTERTAHFLRSLTEAELERSAHHGLAGRPMTVG